MMLNVYESAIPQTNNNNQPFVCADDFISRISAFDETFNQTFGIAPKRNVLSTNDHNSHRIFEIEKTNNSNEETTKHKAKIRSKTFGGRPESERRSVDCESLRVQTQELDFNKFVLRMHSDSVPYALGSQHPDYTTKKRRRQKRIRSLQLSFDSSRKKSDPNLEKTEHDVEKLLSIELHEEDTECDAIAVGLPNLRSLSVIPTEPRPVRARYYFSKLKNGLSDCVEVESNRLQEAELNQDISVSREISQFLNRIQQRLHTITQLEEEYNQYWKAYKKIHVENAQQGSLCQKQSNLAVARELSKSAIGLTSIATSATTTTMEPDLPDVQTSLTSRDSSSFIKPPWFSSMMNVLRTKSKKKIFSSTDSTNTSPKSDDRFSWNKSLSRELCASEFRQKLLTPPKRRKSRATSRTPKPSHDSLLIVTQKQEQYLKQQLCQIEAQIEYLSGTIKCEVVGISGPNNYLSKEEFKVSLKQSSPVLHSLYELDGVKFRLIPLHRSAFTLIPSGTVEQKWNLHGRVQSGSKMRYRRKGSNPFDLGGFNKYAFPKQIWDHPGYVFSPAIDGLFTLKVTELKKFGKDEILLHQAFDFAGLFTSKCYHLSTPLRNQGQVRFNLLIRWCPLADTDDEGLVYYTSPSLQLFNSSSKRKSKTNSIRFLVNEIATDLPSSKLDLLHAASEVDNTPSGSSLRNSLVTDLTRSRSTPSTDNSSQRTSLSGFRLEEKSSDKSTYEPSKITIVHADPQQINCGTKQNVSPLKIWMSMPNLAGNSSQKSMSSTSHFTSSPNAQLKTDYTHEQSSRTSSLSSDLDLLTIPSQSIFVKGGWQSNRPVKMSGENNRLDDCELLNKLNLLQLKLSQSKNLPPMFLDVISNLEEILTELKEKLYKIRSPSSIVHETPQYDGQNEYHSETLNKMKQKLGKHDTLSSLWESFAFLQESSDAVTPSERYCNLPSTSKRSEINYFNFSESPVQSLSTGWRQLDLALVWHLNYIHRLLDRLLQQPVADHILKTSSMNNSTAPSLLPLGNKDPINLITTPIHSYWTTLSLVSQMNALIRISELINCFTNRPKTTPLEYVASLIGGNDGIRMHSCRQCIYPLVWPDCSEESDADLSDEVADPLLMLDVQAFQSTLCDYYCEKVSQVWPEVNASTVIETFLADLMDFDVNGKNVVCVPITHLEQRLRLLEPSNSESSRVSLPNCRLYCEFKLQLNDRLRSVLLYLAGQCYIQDKLQEPTASNMLSTLPYFKRSYQTLFDPPTKLHDLNNTAALPEPLIPLRVIANHSTRTWLEVASLASSKNKEISYKAISLLMNADRNLLEFSESLRFARNSNPQNDTSCSHSCFHLPILYANGPPLHCHLSLVNLIAHSTKPSELLPPLWAGLVWCVEDSPNLVRLRMAGLHGLAVLFEQQHYQLQMKAKQLFQLGTKSDMVMSNVVSVNAVSNLMAYLAAFDQEPQVRRFAKRVIQKLEMQTRVKVSSPRTFSGNPPLKVIWSSPGTAHNQ